MFPYQVSALFVPMVGVAREIFTIRASAMDPSPGSRASMERLSPMKRPDQPDPMSPATSAPPRWLGRGPGWPSCCLERSKPDTTT